MAVDAENIWFENMGFGPPFAIFSPQDCFMGVEDGGFCFQEVDHLNPFVDAYNDHNLTSSSSSTTSFLPLETVQSLSCEFEKQRVEMDWFLQMESKRFRSSILQEESRQQAVIMQRYESRMKSLIVQKDEELALARNRMRELQQFLGGAEMEARAWERAAKEREAVVSDLTNRLNQAKERDDAVSFCGSSGEGGGERKMGCKLCQFRRSCVVFLPCRHLCCCNACEPLLEHCPLCHTVKEATLEAFFP